MNVQTERQTDRQTDKPHELPIYVGLAQGHPNDLICRNLTLLHFKFQEKSALKYPSHTVAP